MADKQFKSSTVPGDNRVSAKDAITECSEDFVQSLDAIPSHPSFIQPLLEQGEMSEDGRKLLRKIKQDPEWKKRVEKMLSFEAHTLKGRLSWEQDKLKEQKRSLSSLKEEGENTHSGQLLQLTQLKQSLREHMTNRIKLESNLTEDKV
ncbi:hypothetical protein LOD99_2801 [Oopsacas minuta]|uniref:Uncharacterized protein n=1 Tax=Oopsacas minuta TaxID=111878 RepID=A0AAV7K128_9METZ|nr:hypothetical protein LOD99_2801 [Oopsacas minuta]